MVLDSVLIGKRIREIRENQLEETRKEFAKRCNMTERYIAKLERGEVSISLPILNKITSTTGVDVNYILYGKGQNNKLQVAKYLHYIIDTSSVEELQMYYKCACAIRNWDNNKAKRIAVYIAVLLLLFILYFNYNIEISKSSISL